MGTNYYYAVYIPDRRLGNLIHIGKGSWMANRTEFMWDIHPSDFAMVMLNAALSVGDPIIIRDEYGVIYDGCPAQAPDVESIFRYYDWDGRE